MKKILLLIGVFLVIGITAYSQVKVTFTVDMSVYQKNGYFNPTTDTVRVAGDFNSWSTTATDLKAGTNADTAKYSVQLSGVTAGAHTYKFIFIHAGTLTWENDPNRSSTIGTNDTTLPVVYFNNLSGKLEHVWFKVDMSAPIAQGKVTIGATNVYLAGDMTDWGTSAKAMTKGANDSVYSVLVDSLSSGSTHLFKFVYSSGGASTGTWEDDPNRTYQVPEQDSSVYQDYWNRVNPNVPTGSGKINFTLDMSVLVKAGIFNTSKDSVLISGGWNGWTTTDPTAFLTQNPVDDSSYFVTQTFTNEPYGAKQYKYVVKLSHPTGIDTIWTDGYERPVARGGDNRQALFMGEANRDTMDYYDGVHPDWFVPSGTNLKVTFTVDMNPAMDPTKQAIPFDPAKDTVYWVSEEPTFARTQGWYKPSSNIMKYFMLSPIGGGVYQGTLTLKEPTFNAFEYLYAWAKGSDGTWIQEPEALGTFDTYRVRYVGQDAASHFPVNPWPMPKDTWTNSNVKTDEGVNPYQSYKDYTGIKTINEKPITYSLSQNYPNPFNPSTLIKFSLEKPGMVLLKVYNILGQEVTTLINQDMKSGTYSVSFDASRLSSGVYFYSIRSGNFVQTKKMMLLK